MDFIKLLQESEEELINIAPPFESVLEEIRKGQGPLRQFYVQQYEKVYGRASVEKLKNPYIGYYRMDAAYAAQYQDKSTNAVIVFLKPSIQNEIDFVDYFGMSVDNFLKQVCDGFILPTIDTATKYTSDFWGGFFQRWTDRSEIRDILPLYSNLIEKIYARDEGIPVQDVWKPFEGKLRQALPLIDKINVDFREVNSRLPPQKALDYYSERLGRLNMLKCQELEESMLEILKKSNVNDLNKHYEYLTLARNFAFSSLHIYGSSIFYAKGGPVNASPSDIDVWSSAFDGVNANYKSKKRERLVNIVTAIDELLGHALVIQPAQLPFAFRQADSREEFERAYDDLNKMDNLTDVRRDGTRLENEIQEKTLSARSAGDITNVQNKINNYLQVANQFFDSLKDARLRSYRFVRHTFNLGATICACVPAVAPISAGLKIISNVAEYLENKEFKKMHKESLYLNYQPPFVLFQMEPPSFIAR